MHRPASWLALAILAVAFGRAPAQEPQPLYRIAADEFGPCIEFDFTESLRRLQSRSPLSADVPVDPSGGELRRRCHWVPPLDTFSSGHGTRHFSIVAWHADMGMSVAELGGLFDEVYEYVSMRTGISVEGFILVIVRPAMDMACPFRGRGSADTIELFGDSSWSREQWLGVFAHELGHVLQFRGSPGVGYLGGQFAQGYASWAGGRYWTDMQAYSSMHAAVRDYLVRETFLPLSTPAEFADPGESDGAADCIARRDIVLTEWASLIEYLVETYGREDFYARAVAALQSGRSVVDYVGIFGRSFEQIEADWLDAVRAQR